MNFEEAKIKLDDMEKDKHCDGTKIKLNDDKIGER